MAKKIIIIIIILILIALVLLFLAKQRQLPTANYQQPTKPVVTNQPPGEKEIFQQPRELTEEEKLAFQKNELMLKARNFAERYGSYSTDARFANLVELKNEMTTRFWQETENYINQKEKETPGEFYGVTTKVLNVKEKSFSENEATYLISTQRQEKKGATGKVFYQDSELKMIKENGGWKVDNIKWQ